MTSEPSIRVIMMPKDTNAHGTIFGGVILSYIDQAAAVDDNGSGVEHTVNRGRVGLMLRGCRLGRR